MAIKETTSLSTSGPVSHLFWKRGKTFTAHSRRVDPVAFSPNGKQIAIASYDGAVRLWDLATGAERSTLKIHLGSEYIGDLVFSPDGKQIAVASGITVHLWDLATGVKCSTFKTHTGHISILEETPWVQKIIFLLDGKQIACVIRDRKVQLWDLTTEADIDAATEVDADAATDDLTVVSCLKKLFK